MSSRADFPIRGTANPNTTASVVRGGVPSAAPMAAVFAGPRPRLILVARLTALHYTREYGEDDPATTGFRIRRIIGTSPRASPTTASKNAQVHSPGYV